MIGCVFIQLLDTSPLIVNEYSTILSLKKILFAVPSNYIVHILDLRVKYVILVVVNVALSF